MNIESIRIQGMHNIVDKTYELGNINYFFGRNGAGKSTVLQAIQLALLGYIPGTDKNKTSIFKHASAPMMAVTLKINDNESIITIRRTWLSGGGNIIATVDVDPEGTDPMSLIGDLELPVFNFSEFIGMTANKLKDWFIKFLPSNTYSIEWKGTLLDAVQKANLSTEAAEGMITSVLDDIQDFESSGLEEVQKANGYFKQRLSFEKENLKRYQATIQNLVYHDDIASTASSKECYDDLQDMLRKKATHNAHIEAIERISGLIEERRACNCSATSADADAEYIQLTDTLKALQTQIDGLKVSLADKHEHVLELKRRKTDLERIISQGATCPVTGQVCATAESVVSDRKDDLVRVQQELDVKAAEEANISERLTLITVEHDTIYRKINEIESRYRRYNAINQSIADLEFKGVDTLFGKSDEEIQSEIESLKVQYNHAVENEQYSKLIEASTAETFRLQNLINVYDCWAKLTGTSGLQSELMGDDQFAPLVQSMELHIGNLLKGARVKFNLVAKSNSFSFGVQRGETYVPYDMLSSGEKCIYMLGLITSIVEFSKAPLPVILIDDVFDHLDDFNVDDVFKSLLTEDTVQFVLAGVNLADALPDVCVINV